MTNYALYNIVIVEITLSKEASPMGQEEVSEIRDLFASKCNLELCKPNMKDASASGKESYMKTNGKKRIFALLLCVMMVVSSMSVWAAYRSRTIGSHPNEQAFCELSLSSSYGEASTTPVNNVGMTLATELAVMDGNGVTYRAYGASVASISRSTLYAAGSSHQAGSFYTTLAI